MKSELKILIACEFSAIVREAFKSKGFVNVWSCDLLDSEIEGQHIKGDVLNILNDGWDVLIGFPPCTYLSYAGTRYWDNEGRIIKRLEALEFFRKLWEADISHISLENPLGIASAVITKHTQIIHPYFFGEPSQKRTCLWLKNLPQLIHIKEPDLFNPITHVEKPSPIYIDYTGKKRYHADANPPGKERSRFWKGIATAMAEQWGDFLIHKYNHADTLRK